MSSITERSRTAGRFRRRKPRVDRSPIAVPLLQFPFDTVLSCVSCIRIIPFWPLPLLSIQPQSSCVPGPYTGGQGRRHTDNATQTKRRIPSIYPGDSMIPRYHNDLRREALSGFVHQSVRKPTFPYRDRSRSGIAYTAPQRTYGTCAAAVVHWARSGHSFRSVGKL